MLVRPLLLGALLVGVGPVEDLLLDELTGGQRLERGARQVQVRLGGDRQELRLILSQHVEFLVEPLEVGVELGLELLLGLGLVFPLEQLFGAVAPRPEVVLVKHHQVPVRLVQPRVLGLDVAGLVSA